MDIGKAVVLGLVQGLTEFLPVSSSGHLIFINDILGYDLQNSSFVSSMPHIGMLLALLLALHRDIIHLVLEGVHMLRDVFRNLGRLLQNSRGAGRGYCRILCNSYRKLFLLLLVSAVPSGLIGFGLADMASADRKITLIPALCMLVTSLFLFLADGAEEGDKKPGRASFWDAVFVGAAQGAATLPGLSGTGAMITAGLLCGFEKRFAVKYSLLLLVPYLSVGIAADWSGGTGMPETAELSCGLVALLVSALAGYFAICLLLAFARRRSYRFYAIYCSLFGILFTALCLAV